MWTERREVNQRKRNIKEIKSRLRPPWSTLKLGKVLGNRGGCIKPTNEQQLGKSWEAKEECGLSEMRTEV